MTPRYMLQLPEALRAQAARRHRRLVRIEATGAVGKDTSPEPKTNAPWQIAWHLYRHKAFDPACLVSGRLRDNRSDSGCAMLAEQDVKDSIKRAKFRLWAWQHLVNMIFGAPADIFACLLSVADENPSANPITPSF